MALKDEVVHANICKEVFDWLTADFIIHVASHNDLVSHLDPFLKLFLQVLHESQPWVPVIVLVIEVSFVLGPRCAFSSLAVTGFVNAHHSKNHAMLSSEPGPVFRLDIEFRVVV